MKCKWNTPFEYANFCWKLILRKIHFSCHGITQLDKAWKMFFLVFLQKIVKYKIYFVLFCAIRLFTHFLQSYVLFLCQWRLRLHVHRDQTKFYVICYFWWIYLLFCILYITLFAVKPKLQWSEKMGADVHVWCHSRERQRITNDSRKRCRILIFSMQFYTNTNIILI